MHKTLKMRYIKQKKLVEMGGIGHALLVYIPIKTTVLEHVAYFGDKMKTSRILINTPASHKGVLVTYTTFKLAPSLTFRLWLMGVVTPFLRERRAKNTLSNTKTVAKRAENMLWHKLPKSIYFRRGCLPIAHWKRLQLMVKTRIYRLQTVSYSTTVTLMEVTNVLKKFGVETEVSLKLKQIPH